MTHLENKRSRGVVNGDSTDDGAQCTVVVAHERTGHWAIYPQRLGQVQCAVARHRHSGALHFGERPVILPGVTSANVDLDRLGCSTPEEEDDTTMPVRNDKPTR